MITKSDLIAERDRLTSTRDQSIANANACAGALALIESLLVKCEDVPEGPYVSVSDDEKKQAALTDLLKNAMPATE